MKFQYTFLTRKVFEGGKHLLEGHIITWQGCLCHSFLNTLYTCTFILPKRSPYTLLYPANLLLDGSIRPADNVALAEIAPLPHLRATRHSCIIADCCGGATVDRERIRAHPHPETHETGSLETVRFLHYNPLLRGGFFLFLLLMTNFFLFSRNEPSFSRIFT